MKPFDKCPVCGGELERKQVEKLLSGGGNTAAMKVAAEVCLHCGEKLYSEDAVQSFAEIREKLRRREFSYFKTLGQSFTVAEGWPDRAIQSINPRTGT